MTTVPAACQPIQDRLAALKERAQQIAALFNTNPAPTAGERAALARELEQVDEQIDATTAELDACVGPPPQPLDASLTGTATLTTTAHQATGPYTIAITVGLHFDGPRTEVIVTNFPSITTAPTDTPLGPVTITITLAGGGVGTYSSGEISLPITLHFEPDKSFPFELGPSDLALTLTTAAPGSSVDPAGIVTLVGTGTFTGGPPLSGHNGTLTLQGAIRPHP